MFYEHLKKLHYYDLKNQKGFIKDVYGSINFDSLETLKISKEIDNRINEEIFEDTKVKNVKLKSSSTLGFEDLNLKEYLKEKKKVYTESDAYHYESEEEAKEKAKKAVDFD